MTKKNKKYLHIKMEKETIDSSIKEYCEEMDLDLRDLGYHMGNIAGRSDNLARSMYALLKVHFFAGILYAKKHEDDYKIEHLSKKEVNELVSEENDEEEHINSSKTELSYMG